jgi:putative DNA primase/helicase
MKKLTLSSTPSSASKPNLCKTPSKRNAVSSLSSGPTRLNPRGPAVTSFHNTDAGNAELFAALFGSEVRYDHKHGRWLFWQDHWWAEDTDGSLQRLAKAAVRWRADAASKLKDKKKRKKQAAWALLSEARTRLEAALKLAQSEHPIADSGANWDSEPMLLGVANGVVDLSTGALRRGRQEDRITLHSNIRFNPHAKCPRWLKFLDEIFGGHQELVKFIQRAVGYCLTGDTREQVLFLCYGTGANGKSTFLEVIRLALGDYAYNLPFSSFELKSRSGINNDIAALEGRRYVTALETSESVQLNEARIKSLTGCDPASARFLYHEFFTFIPKAKYWLAFNHKPEVADDSEGFWRRVRLIPFEQQFSKEKADPELLEKLKAEARESSPGLYVAAWNGSKMGSEYLPSYRKPHARIERKATPCMSSSMQNVYLERRSAFRPPTSGRNTAVGQKQTGRPRLVKKHLASGSRLVSSGASPPAITKPGPGLVSD